MTSLRAPPAVLAQKAVAQKAVAVVVEIAGSDRSSFSSD
jgi:hypothetical protein